MKDNYEICITLDDAVRTLIQLRALDITICREIINGKNIINNLGMLKVNEDVHNILYAQVADIIDKSRYAEIYAQYQRTDLMHLGYIAELIKEAEEENEA